MGASLLALAKSIHYVWFARQISLSQRPRTICCVQIVRVQQEIIRSLSKDAFERRTSTDSEAFPLLICLGANKFLILSVFFSHRDYLPKTLGNIAP